VNPGISEESGDTDLDSVEPYGRHAMSKLDRRPKKGSFR
jgi:hypothetical protein